MASVKAVRCSSGGGRSVAFVGGYLSSPMELIGLHVRCGKVAPRAACFLARLSADRHTCLSALLTSARVVSAAIEEQPRFERFHHRSASTALVECRQESKELSGKSRKPPATKQQQRPSSRKEELVYPVQEPDRQPARPPASSLGRSFISIKGNRRRLEKPSSDPLLAKKRNRPGWLASYLRSFLAGWLAS